MKIDPKVILDEIKAGEKVSNDIIASVASALEDPHSPFDKYTLIHILGRSLHSEFRPLVERFLVSPADPQLARISLVVLCEMWGLAATYLAQLEEFIKSVAWDVDQEVRQIAISIIGEYLRENPNQTLMKLLLDIFEDSSEWGLIREDAVRAIARALGLDHGDIPSAARREPLDSEWSRGVAVAARARLTG